MLTPQDLTRRKFIGNACAAVGATGVLSALAQLRMIGAVAADAAEASGSNYKALVCVFLYGGSDSNNVVIPVDNTDYNLYASQRTALAIPQSSVLPISPKTYSDGRSYGLHPSYPEIQSLFGKGQLAILANTGTLTYPTTLSQYTSGSASLPPQLFSHADQQTQWQSSLPDQPFQTGWGGRLADMINAINTNSTISMSISVAGENSFQIGQTVSQYAVSPTGAVSLTGATGGTINPIRYQAQLDLLSQNEQSLFQAAFANVTGSAVTDSALLTSVLSGAATLQTQFPNTSLGTQLQMIARLISAAPQFGLKRQIYFASLGGFDTHTVELTTQGPLLVQVSQALNAFYNATVELGVASQVTTFTASDFSRTYNTNGNGADHGWGSHHLILGGAVNGGDIYGKMPSLEIGGPDDTGRGRWIPSTSVDQYAATLATWFGVSQSNLPVVLPNIGRFPTANLGFMSSS